MAPGDWLTYRRDDLLSAHCPVPGRIANPAVRWTLPIGGSMQRVVALPREAGPTELLICYGGVVHCMTLRGELVWQSAPQGFQDVACVCDIDGDGDFEIVAASQYGVHVLHAETGAVLWSRRFSPPDYFGVFAATIRVHRLLPGRLGMQLIVPAPHNRAIPVYDFSGGADRGVLIAELEMPDAFHPTIVIGDVDGDDADEIVVTRLGSVGVFDPDGGRCKALSTWETDGLRRRGYGQIVLHDVDDDGDLELVVFARHVTRHIAVLDNDGAGNFFPLWDRMIEHIYPDDHTDLRYCQHSVADVDGDGDTELVVSIFDEHDDGRWHTEIIDACSGETKLDLPDVIVADVADIDNDEHEEILTSSTSGRIVDGARLLRAERIDSGVVSTVWQRNDARFAFKTTSQTLRIGKYRPGPFDDDEVWTDFSGFTIFDQHDRLLHVNPRAFETLPLTDAPAHAAGQPATGNGQPSLRVAAQIAGRSVLTSATGDVTVIGFPRRIDPAEPRPAANNGHGASSDPAPTTINREPTITIHCGQSWATNGHAIERPSPTPVVFTAGGRRCAAVAENSETIALYSVANDEPKLLWRVAGRGRIGFDRSHHSVSVADVNGDGELEVLFATDDGLCAMSVAGDLIACFKPPMLATPIRGPRVGLYDWIVFRDGDRTRVFVSWYASESMNSEESCVIDAATSDVIWSRRRVGEEIEGVGFGAWGAASCDGVLAWFCAKAFLCVVDLRTGELARPIVNLTDLTREAMKAAGTFVDGGPETLVTKDDPFTAYGSVVLCDVDGDGVREAVVVGCLGGFGVVDAAGRVRWWHSAPSTEVMYRFGSVCDIDGDGRQELLIGNAAGELVCYAADSGVERWRLPLGDTTLDCATCDIDGNGRAECICRTTDGRVIALAVDRNGSPFVKWAHRFPYAAGNPVIAVLDEARGAEILITTGDGSLHCIGERG